MEKIREIFIGKEKLKTFLAIIIVFIFQLIVCIWFGFQKQTFFCDEVYSYGLANSENYTFLDDIAAENSPEWFSSKKFKEYVTTDISKIFSFKQAYINQSKDTLPPLYYYMLHITSAFTGDNFTKWSGLSLNFIFLFFINFVFFYIAKEFLQSRKKAFLALILWSFCAAGISNILYIRMYLLLTLEILLYSAWHIKMIKKNNETSKWDYISIFTIFVAGGLTHYHFYIFAGVLSFIYSVLLVLQKKYKEFAKYSIILILAFLVNIICFPPIWYHLFSNYRGIEAMYNLSGGRTESVLITSYFSAINRSLTGNSILLIILVVFVLEFLKNLKRGTLLLWENIEKAYNKTAYWAIIITGAVFLSIATQSASIIHNRYIYVIYPILAIVLVDIIFYILKHIKLSNNIKYAISFFVILSFCCKSIFLSGIDFQYLEHKELIPEINQTKNCDCLIYLNKNLFWRDLYTDIPAKFNYDEVLYFNEKDIKNLEKLIQNRKTKDTLLVNLSNKFDLEKNMVILEEILAKTSYKNYKLLYTFEESCIFILEQ